MSEETTWAVQELRDEMKRQSAILAVFLNEYQNANREPDENVVSLRETANWIDDMEYTLYEEEE